MPFHSPLRYPGGKRRLTHLVAELIDKNRLRDIEYVEPYAGGASMALDLLFNEYASAIHINDLSRPVFAFWKTLLEENERLCCRIDATPVTVKEWHRQHEVYRQQEHSDLFDLGFAAFFLNRTNRSGIISGRMIGGMGQTGRWKLDARFNKVDLMRRIKKIGRYRTRISVSQEDAAAFIDETSARLGQNALFLIDPPYIDRGKDLYLNNYGLDDHKMLEQQISALDRYWIVTYDYDAAIRHQLHQGRTCLSFSLSYSAQQRRRGREAMFLSDSIEIPSTWRDANGISVGPRGGRQPLEARVETTNGRLDQPTSPMRVASSRSMQGQVS